MIAPLAGLLAGIVHVLAGPDHLAAIALLAANRRVRPWVTGLMWGMGHSLGILLVALAALGLRGMVPVEVLSSVGERLVGVALVLVGLWGLRRAFSHRLHAHDHVHQGVVHTHIHVHDPHLNHGEGSSHIHTHGSVAIGALHGLAGSAGIFAILPALGLPTLGDSLLYLGAFVAGSLAAMTAYSWAIGTALNRLRLFSIRPYRYLLSGASAMAVMLGCVWLLG